MEEKIDGDVYNTVNDLTEQYEDGLHEEKRGGKWQMRMFKRGGDDLDLTEEEFENYQNDLEKRDPWQMRMFKRCNHISL